MAILRGDEQLDSLVISGQFDPGIVTLDPIKLPNNTSLKIDLSGVTVNPSNQEITNPEQISILKIVIKWGDGSSNTIAPLFEKQTSSINTKFEDWTVTSHTYSLGDTQTELTLEIDVYNSLNDCATLLVPITIQFQSLLESGAKLNLISANITNDNRVSYVLNNTAQQASFVVSTNK